METTLVKKVVDELIRCTECKQLNSVSHNCAFQSSKNHLFKRLCFGITVKCSFAAYGCHFVGNGMEVYSHEENGDCSNSTIEPSNIKGSLVYSMEEAILAELQCPICYTCIKPPIKQCLNGHPLCNDCTKQVQICPICRGPRADEVNLSLEYFCRLVEVPCRNVTSGCVIRRMGEKVVVHERRCVLTPRLCPLNDHEECRWSGLTMEIADHCKRQHFDKLHMESEHKWNLEEFMSDMFHINLFCTYDVLFKCMWYIRGDSVMFSINYILNKPTPDRFKYEMKICFAGTDNASPIIVDGKCAHSNDGGFQCIVFDSILVPSELLYSHIDEDREIIFVLNIIDGMNKKFLGSK